MSIDAAKLNRATRLIESIKNMQHFLKIIGGSDGYLRVSQWINEYTKEASISLTVRVAASLVDAITKDMLEAEAELRDLVGGASDDLVADSID